MDVFGSALRRYPELGFGSGVADCNPPHPSPSPALGRGRRLQRLRPHQTKHAEVTL